MDVTDRMRSFAGPAPPLKGILRCHFRRGAVTNENAIRLNKELV